MQHLTNNTSSNNTSLNQSSNITPEQRVALQIKAWTELFKPNDPDLRLKEAEIVAKFSNFFELLSSVSCAGLNIHDIFDATTLDDKMFIEWFESFNQGNEQGFFKKYLP